MKHRPRIALYEPDIPQNTAAIIRTCACFGAKLEIIEPCGFTFSKQRLRRSGLDYLEHVDLKLHQSWEDFYDLRVRSIGRLLLLTTKSELAYTSFDYHDQDILLFGRESAGVPNKVHKAVDARLTIPMMRGMRSINVAQSVSMVLGEGLRQIKISSGTKEY